MEIQELCKLGFRCVLSSRTVWRYRNSANSGSDVYCRVVSRDTHSANSGSDYSVLSSSQWRYRNSANSGSGVYCRVDSGDTGTLQTRVQVCIVE